MLFFKVRLLSLIAPIAYKSVVPSENFYLD